MGFGFQLGFLAIFIITFCVAAAFGNGGAWKDPREAPWPDQKMFDREGPER